MRQKVGRSAGKRAGNGVKYAEGEKMTGGAKMKTNKTKRKSLKSIYKRKSVAELIAEQGYVPKSFDELKVNIWPKNESVDDFLAARREWHKGRETPKYLSAKANKK